MSDAEVLKIIRDRLSGRIDVKRVILFGSRATGKATPESDYDVLVIADTEIPFIRRQGLALLDLGTRAFSVDLLVYTPEEAERESRMLGSAVYWAEREGKEYVA
ncbi:MAG: nucleotidyltransferase domain-containing protein [Fimbriimonas sp.]|nr:nucleotidyltransferase domain-containing protein [Fimbriimonas sp.]